MSRSVKMPTSLPRFMTRVEPTFPRAMMVAASATVVDVLAS
jgi:hypothetical protein